MESDSLGGPYRIGSTVAKTRTGEPAPYEVSEEHEWFEPDGTPITDQARIDELEAKHGPEKETT
jgi:hypothetical protein